MATVIGVQAHEEGSRQCRHGRREEAVTKKLVNIAPVTLVDLQSGQGLKKVQRLGMK